MNLLDIIDEYGVLNEKLVAHHYRDSILTYKELKEKSDALAFYLTERYGNDKTPIVVYGHKQHNMLICFLACVKSGHAYVPVDSSLPLERIKDIIISSEAKLIFQVSDLEYKFDDSISVIDNNIINECISEYDGKKPDKEYRVNKEDIYYMIYTSGSTGKPKGVQITFACLESFVTWGMGLCNLKGKAVFMNQAPFSFDLSVMDLYLSLATGSTLYSVDKVMLTSLKELFSYFKDSQISIWVSTPSFAEMCLADSNFNDELLPKLNLMLFCGETLTNTCVSKLHSRFKNTKIINTYGPTEATVAVTAVEVDEEINSKFSPLPVGKVKNDCKIMILDPEGKEVSDGERGEIIIVGDSVSPGYYRNKPMTEKSFFKSEINGVSKRAYRTGDEGYLKDGLLYYSGRIDFQVKLNGFRIEIEDIENNLRKTSIVRNAIVFPIIKEGKIQYLAAAVTLNEVINEKEFKIVVRIKDELKKLLPEYMIPRKIAIKDSLPMTPNGKVNRKILMEETK